MLYQLCLHISKTRNLLLYVTNITDLSAILYLISLSYFFLDIETSSSDS